MDLKRRILLIVTMLVLSIMTESVVFANNYTSTSNLNNYKKNLKKKEESLNSLNIDIRSTQRLIKEEKKHINTLEKDISSFEEIKHDIIYTYTLDIVYQNSIDSFQNLLIKHKKDALKEIQGYNKQLKKLKFKRKKLRKSIKAIKNKIAKIKEKSFNGVLLSYDEAYNVSSNKLTKSKGVVRYNGHRETYYSQRVLSGTGLKIPGRHVAKDGTIRDKDGYICVAANPSFFARYSLLMISLGPAKVYDCGCTYGTIDVYCNW